MAFPKQAAPVKRPHFTQPALAVDVENGSIDSLVHIRMDLLHGANYNDPAVFAPRSYDRVMNSGWSGFGGIGRHF
ncbi:cyanobactin biosynthesis system PatB/AcyB/McaB family protein [Lyngbya sp. CCY1209]|uniref:cyanobactin biosynthesis system PatB/AcyB/McaB family protein n=1 Tax=Lyngbya sp. CCY1209 TaxID=2886103 RepID=UPI002D216FB4|nr:cyanobactin biosynthesis system PatB/AcyB/McaB family protein [Lyngbya sp. CCY1209]MEB3883427.1 cyanobactin biosynthesis system PatB/AcyB/McaB family protein [Lyngbya sp. CCY1209]